MILMRFWAVHQIIVSYTLSFSQVVLNDRLIFLLLLIEIDGQALNLGVPLYLV